MAQRVAFWSFVFMSWTSAWSGNWTGCGAAMIGALGLTAMHWTELSSREKE